MDHPRWLIWLALSFPFVIGGCAAPVVPPAVPATPADLFKTTTAGDTTVVAVAPPSSECCPPPTVWDILGVTQCTNNARACCGTLSAQLAFCFPGLGSFLEPTPPLLPLTDPANLASDVPAISKAAEIKAEEDLAPQKIAALRYLATIGCGGCYKSVEDAFIAALGDCTEVVRYEAVKALRDTSTCACQFCNKEACCSEKIQKKLREMAEGVDENGCPKEMSDRVRRQARLALAECGPPPPEAAAAPAQTESPEEGPTEGPAAPENGSPEEPPAADPTRDLPPPAEQEPDSTARRLPPTGIPTPTPGTRATIPAAAIMRLPSTEGSQPPAFPQFIKR
jgi:hypothetical protein